MSPSPVVFSAATSKSSQAKAESKGGGQKLVHACLLLHEPSRDGSLTKPGPQIDSIPFQFNPKELSLSKSAQWKRHAASGNKKSAPPQYQGTAPSKLSLEMFFDATDNHGTRVVDRVEQLFSACVPTTDSHSKDKANPPWVLFQWGGLTGFLAYISSVTAKYTVFTEEGLPVRAVCTVTLEELAGELPKQNPTSGGLRPRRVHTVIDGDTLAGIAYAEYGDASMWRAVAHANGIDDPIRIRSGTTLLLPSPEEALAPAAYQPALDPEQLARTSQPREVAHAR